MSIEALDWYKREQRRFLSATAGWSLENKGAYGILIDLIMDQPRGLIDNDQWIAGQLGTSVRKWRVIKSFLISQGKIYIENGIISNKKADKNKINQRLYQDKQAENRKNPNKNKEYASTVVASREDKKIEDIIDKSIIVKEIKKKKSCGLAALKIERLPDDWLAYSKAKNLSQSQAEFQFEKFKNFWLSNGSSKADWLATWRNWIINQIDKYGLKPDGGNDGQESETIQDLLIRIDEGRANWTSNHTLRYQMTESQARQLVENPKLRKVK